MTNLDNIETKDGLQRVQKNFVDLNLYASLVLLAKQCRQNGNLTYAKVIERELECIYAGLDEEFKWKKQADS